jgi:hypothetical protein
MYLPRKSPVHVYDGPFDEAGEKVYNTIYSIISEEMGMRRLKSPTLQQWGCHHRWKTTTSRPGDDDVVRIRYLICRRCGLKVKTEERLAVP